MSRWTHQICERCFFNGPGRTDANTVRMPIQVIGGNDETGGIGTCHFWSRASPASSSGTTRLTCSAGSSMTEKVNVDELCCRGNCKRKQAPMLMRGGLTDRWYVVLRYKDLGDGRFEALDKHELHPDSMRQLNRLLAGPEGGEDRD
jgi:hypothetical protein